MTEASRKILADVAEQVFARYAKAPERVETALAEKFLRVGNPAAITSTHDPLGLVEITGGRPGIKTAHKAIVSIHDYIDRSGTVEGERLLDHFSDAPFGWSPDTVRYILAAMLVAGEIKLKVSAREVTAAGQRPSRRSGPKRLKKDDFYRHAADLSSLLTDIKARVRDAAINLGEQQKVRLKEGAQTFSTCPSGKSSLKKSARTPRHGWMAWR